MNTLTDIQKSSYQIKKEKAGMRFGILSFFLLVLILLSNVDDSYAASKPELRVDGFGYNFASMQHSIDKKEYGTIEFVDHMPDEQLNVAALAGSDLIVLDGINDLAGFFELVENLPDTLVVVVGESLFGQGLMLDNLLMTHAFIADETIIALLKMKHINPALSLAQLRLGLFGDDVYDQTALEHSGQLVPVNLEQAEDFAYATLKDDHEAPRVIAAAKQGKKRITANVEDNRGVAYVEVYVNEKFVGRDFEAPYEFDVDSGDNGLVSLVAYDSAANYSRLDLK